MQVIIIINSFIFIFFESNICYFKLDISFAFAIKQGSVTKIM